MGRVSSIIEKLTAVGLMVSGGVLLLVEISKLIRAFAGFSYGAEEGLYDFAWSLLGMILFMGGFSWWSILRSEKR